MVACCPAYEVSSLGRLRRATSARGTRVGRLVRPKPMKNGYLIVHLTVGDRSLTKTVHRLVAAAFLGPVPDELDVCHKDGDRSNNVPTNLRIDTRAGNMADTIEHGTHNRGERSASNVHAEQFVRVVKQRLAAGARPKDLADDYGVPAEWVRKVKRGSIWRWLEA